MKQDRFSIRTAARSANGREATEVATAPTVQQARNIALRHYVQGKGAWVWDRRLKRFV